MCRTLLIFVIWMSQEVTAGQGYARIGVLSYLGISIRPLLIAGAGLIVQPPRSYPKVITKLPQPLAIPQKSLDVQVKPEKIFDFFPSKKHLEIPSCVRAAFTDPMVSIRELERRHGIVIVSSQSRSQQNPLLWTQEEQDVLDSLRVQLPLNYTLLGEDLPSLTECNEEIIRLMGEFFRLRGQYPHLPSIASENILQLRYIFQKFADAGFMRQKDIKLYRDHFFEIDD